MDIMEESLATRQAGTGRQDAISVVVVTYFTGAYLTECLDRIDSLPEVREVLVVDNGNDAHMRKWMDDFARTRTKVQLIRPGRNIGFAAGCNLGASAACGEYVAFVNPDTLLPPATFSKVLDIFAERPDAWLCGGRLLNMDGTEQRGGRREILSPWRAFVELTRLNRLFPNHPHFQRLHRYEDKPETNVVEVPTVSGAFMVLPKRRFDTIGGMDDNMFLHFDDADLCLRVLKAGGKILYCGSVPVYHHLSTSDVSRTFIEWHKTRSTSYYFYKHFHETYPWWILSLISKMLWLRFFILALKLLPEEVLRLVRGHPATRPAASATPK